MTKLTQEMRDHILGQVMKTVFPEDKNPLPALKKAAYEAVYDQLVPLDQRKLIAKLTVGTVDECTQIYILVKSASGETLRYGHCFEGAPHRWPNFARSSSVLNTSAAGIAILAYSDAQKSRTTDMEQFRTKVYAALKSFTTVAKLLEAWPMIAQIMPKEYFTSHVIGTLPTVSLTDLQERVAKAAADAKASEKKVKKAAN